MKASLPLNEAQRLATLRGYDVLDTLPEQAFDDLTLLASQICQTPIALVSLIDENRQWFKSKIGLSTAETSRDFAFCAHAILYSDEVLQVRDAQLDPRFSDNPLVTADPHIRFYAGAPLIAADGSALGTLCVIDQEPRELSEAQKQALQALGRHVVNLLELRRSIMEQKQIEEALHESEERFRDLVENANDLIQICDMDGSILYTNRAWREALGYSEKEIAGLTLQDVIHPESLDHCMEQFQKVIEETKLMDIEAVFQAKDGHPVVVEGSATCRFNDGKPISTRSIFRDITKRKRAEQERDRLFNYSVDMICIAGFDGYFKQLNPAWEHTLGWSKDELLAKPFIEFVHPDDREVTTNQAYKLADGDAIFAFDNRYLCKNGSYKWLSWLGSPFSQEGFIFAIARDVTERKLADETLYEIMERQHAILNHAGHGIISATPDGIITSFNPAAEQMLGYWSEKAIGSAVSEAIFDRTEIFERSKSLTAELGETIEPGFATLVAKALRNLPDQHEWTFIRRDGTRFPVLLSVTALHDLEGEVTGYLGLAVDISEQKKTQLALEQFKYSLDQTVDCVFIFHADDLRFTYVNEGAKRQVGYTEAELLQMTVLDIKPKFTLESFRLMAQPLLDGTQASLTFETVHRHKDGHEIPVEVALQAVRQGTLKPHLIAIVRDITERKRADQLVRAKNEELKTFAYTVSHDLKAPLRGIAGYAQELERRHKEGLADRAQFCITQIITAAKNLDSLIEDLLKYSRLDTETSTLTEVNLFDLVQSILRDRSHTITEQCVEVSVKVPPITLLTWERGLHQVLANLIDNAIKYSRNSRPPRLIISAEALTSGYFVTVADNGIGFDMKYHDRIFGLFNRLVRADEFDGTGAGLAIVKKLIEKLGGSIRAESTPGDGATFFVELPTTTEPMP